MKNKLKKWLTRSLISSLVFSGFITSALTASAFTVMDPDLYVEFNLIPRHSTPTQADIRIQNVVVENRTFDPYDNQDGEVSFYLNKGAYITLEISEEDDNDIVVKPYRREYFSKGEVVLEWDGRDDKGDIVSTDKYEFKIIAEVGGDRDTEKGTFIVKKGVDDGGNTTKPRLKSAFTTKESFDPGSGEFINIAYELTAEADVLINVYDSRNNIIERIYKKNNQRAGIYYHEWDGEIAIDREGDYTIRIIVKNNKGTDSTELEIEIEEDKYENAKANIYKDRAEKVIFEPRSNNQIITFRSDNDADGELQIKQGGRTIFEVEDLDIDEGTNRFTWDGRDDYGDYVEDGIYRYKITSSTSRGRDHEEGYFLVEDCTDARNPRGNSPFNDVDESHKFYESIIWAVDEDIYDGYGNGYFGPQDYVRRDQAAKIILNAFNIRTYNAQGTYTFKDVSQYDWSTDYIATAASLGIIEGYPGNYYKPGSYITRGEAAKIILETAEIKYDLTIPTQKHGMPFYDVVQSHWAISHIWFVKANDLNYNSTYFYPDKPMTRAEMADMLYRFFKVANLDSY